MPLRSVNNYGLFAVMTTTRDEIAVEVSVDGREWREWPFRYKPGDVRRAPPVVAPHMPRLDWQMWFAALGSPSPWFGATCSTASWQGSPDVEALLGPPPFGDARLAPEVRARDDVELPFRHSRGEARRTAPGGIASAKGFISPSSR